MSRSLIRTMFAAGALVVGVPVAARAADQTAAEKEGVHMVDVGHAEQQAAAADQAKADQLMQQGKALEETAERNNNKQAEAQANQMQKKAKAMQKAAKARREAAEEMIDDGREVARAGAQQKAAEENARAMP